MGQLVWNGLLVDWDAPSCSLIILSQIVDNVNTYFISQSGNGLPSSTGGSLIKEYEISYDELEDFSGNDAGRLVTTNTFYTIENLTPGRRYYIRVLARNNQGAGQYCAYMEENCLIVHKQVSATAKL